MASSYKTFSTNDIVSTKTLLHEAIPLTGTVLSGTYVDGTTETNIKNYSHGMFQSVYDYPYLSSSANHIVDITLGYSANSKVSSSANVQNAKKINIYNQMAQVLVGHDANGNIREFDEDGDLTEGSKIQECFFLNFSRLLTKDEIKKGSFSLVLGTQTTHAQAHQYQITITDKNAQNDYRVNSPAGDYAILYADSSKGGDHLVDDSGNQKVGLIYYQAGVCVITGAVFHNDDGRSSGIIEGGTIAGDSKMIHFDWGDGDADGADNTRFSDGGSGKNLLEHFSISSSCDGIRHRISDISFNNTTELNSTIYFCRVNHNEFNYSANPTYTTNSKINVKNISSDSPISYITTVGLYSADNELMAVAKLSEPLKKDPTNELTLRVRLDY